MNRKTNKTKKKDNPIYSNKLTFPVLKNKEPEEKKSTRNEHKMISKNTESQFYSVTDSEFSQTQNYNNNYQRNIKSQGGIPDKGDLQNLGETGSYLYSKSKYGLEGWIATSLLF